MTTESACPLCLREHERVLWQTPECRIIAVEMLGYPGYCRVIWNTHVSEMTDLNRDQRQFFLDVVFVVEKLLREKLSPQKMNLASLGNYVPHLHWHVIPRFTNDPHFPDSIWSAPKRSVDNQLVFDWDAFTVTLGEHLSPTV